MRQANNAIVQKFISGSNTNALKNTINKQFPGNTLDFDESIKHFSQRMVKELYMSDPIGSIDYQVQCFNSAFIEDRSNFIRQTLAPSVTAYSVGDNQPLSRYKQNLDTWSNNPAPGQCLRDDMQGAPRSVYNEFGCDPGAAITFCDQSHLNTSYHTEAFNTPWMQAMNRQVAVDDAGFGNPTPESDARLLSRRVFRNNNEIPQYERRLQRRHVDYDIGETLHNDGERGYIQHGFDTSSQAIRKEVTRIPARPCPQKINLDTTGRYR